MNSRFAARMQYLGNDVYEATDAVMQQLTTQFGPDTGGLVAMDKDGHIAMPFNTFGMYRGYIRSNGKAHVFLYEDEVTKN